MDLPPLLPINDKLHQIMRGPTVCSNWVVPGMVMAGAYPGALEDRANELQLKTILNKGIDTFVCLQDELTDEIPEEVWRSGNGLRPYFVDARRISKKPLIWRHLPIVDGSVADDDVTEALVLDLIEDIKAGRILYVHCWGGHGRAGVVVALLLAVLYGLPVNEALKRSQAYHDCRVETQNVKSPSTVAQRTQVKRLLQKWKNDAGPAAETYLEEETAKVEQGPQLVIAKNGARGFIVQPMQRAQSLPRIAKDEARHESSDLVLLKSRAKMLPSASLTSLNAKAYPSGPALGGASFAPLRDLSLQKSSGTLATRFRSGVAASTGAASAPKRRLF